MPTPPTPAPSTARKRKRVATGNTSSVPVAPPRRPLSWRERLGVWTTEYRLFIDTGRFGVVIGAILCGINSGDMFGVYWSFGLGYIISALCIIVVPVRSSRWRAVASSLVLTAFAGGTVILGYHHSALDMPSATTTPLQLRPRFSQTQTISNAGSLSGQSEELNLDNIATLQIFPPYSTESVTLMLDPNPTYYPGYSTKQIDVLQMKIMRGDHTRYTFDKGNNKRQYIQVGTRKFLVTLMSTRLPDKPILAVQIEYTFGISEE